MQGALDFLASFFRQRGEKRLAVDIVSAWVIASALTGSLFAPTWALPLLALIAHPFVCWVLARVIAAWR